MKSNLKKINDLIPSTKDADISERLSRGDKEQITGMKIAFLKGVESLLIGAGAENARATVKDLDAKIKKTLKV